MLPADEAPKPKKIIFKTAPLNLQNRARNVADVGAKGEAAAQPQPLPVPKMPTAITPKTPALPEPNSPNFATFPTLIEGPEMTQPAFTGNSPSPKPTAGHVGSPRLPVSPVLQATPAKGSDFETLAMSVQTSFYQQSPGKVPGMAAPAKHSGVPGSGPQENIEFLQRKVKATGRQPMAPAQPAAPQPAATVSEATMNMSAKDYLGEPPAVAATMNMSEQEYLDQAAMSQSPPIAASTQPPKPTAQNQFGARSAQATTKAQTPSDNASKKDPFQLFGTIFAGKYEITGFLGQGGMGAVYLSKHRMLGKERAIKVLVKTADTDPNAVQRFFHEARAAALVEHPNVVQVHDVDETEKFHFIVMEYVKGESLEKITQRAGTMPSLDAAMATKATAFGLSAIHKAGLVHRDIKPANLLLSHTGEVKITDFGIVKDLGASTALTAASMIVGTPQFMSPEQLSKTGIDCRSDIYSLGATLYYLVTGKPCFTGTMMQMIYQIMQAQPIPAHELNPKVDEYLSSIILKMLAKLPKDRYQTMDEVCEALEKYLAKQR